MGLLDLALVKMEASKLKRQEDLERRRSQKNTYKLVHEEHVFLISTSSEDEAEATGDEFRTIEPSTSFAILPMLYLKLSFLIIIN